MKYTISEVLGQSIMTKTPSIIVEGVDDVKIYDLISESIEKKSFIIPVECVDGYSEGNQHVINAMNNVNSIRSTKYNSSHYILGIIDKDVRDFRNEIPENPLILPLNVYSIESHFVNSESIIFFIKEVTKATSDLIGEELASYVHEQILCNFHDLFLFSLDALKGSLDSSYDSYLGYSDSEGRTIIEKDVLEIRKREQDLLQFANTLNIPYTLESLKKISKGKWILFLFCYHLDKVIKRLPEKCKDHSIKSCRVCLADVEKCLYKMREGINHKTIKSILLNKVLFTEMDYIRQRFTTLC